MRFAAAKQDVNALASPRVTADALPGPSRCKGPPMAPRGRLVLPTCHLWQIFGPRDLHKSARAEGRGVGGTAGHGRLPPKRSPGAARGPAQCSTAARAHGARKGRVGALRPMFAAHSMLAGRSLNMLSRWNAEARGPTRPLFGDAATSTTTPAPAERSSLARVDGATRVSPFATASLLHPARCPLAALRLSRHGRLVRTFHVPRRGRTGHPLAHGHRRDDDGRAVAVGRPHGARGRHRGAASA